MNRRTLGSLLLLLTSIACTSSGDDPAPVAEEKSSGAPTNRLDLPATARSNLGITFARAEYRAVTETLLLPGQFEVRPSGQHHYPVPSAGRVTLHVELLETVEAGQLLLEIDAPDWRALQLELVDAQTTRIAADAKVARAQAARLAAGSLDRPERPGTTPDVFTVELQAAESEVEAAKARLTQLIAKAATLTGLSPTDLTAEVDGKPKWRRLAQIPIRALTAGVVREIDAASGMWVEAGVEVVHALQPRALQFRASALQSDLLDQLRDGQPASIVPPEGNGAARRAPGIAGTVRIGVTGNSESRTIDVWIDFDADTESAAWARASLLALAEVVVAGSETPVELAIPARAVIRDGLESVFFRRDPKNRDVVIRTIADLGASDGRSVEVLSGLIEGEEVVVDGIYPLKLATSGRQVTTGHFHADGTFHEGDH